MTLLYVQQLIAKSIPHFTIIAKAYRLCKPVAKVITTDHPDELDKNMKIENKSTRAEERPIMPFQFF